MVSFQCHTCGDVVKKPKLDQHRSGCHGGFDCIDCSTTFNTPGEYKGHTSCISEAEKYQKKLFKGPKKGVNGQSNNNQSQPLPQPKNETIETSTSRQSNAQWNRTPQPTSLNNVNGYPGPQHIQRQPQWHDRYTNGRGGREHRPPRPSASGANDTPLGIPRMTSRAGFGSSMAPAVEPKADVAGRIDGAQESVSTQIEDKQSLVKVDKAREKTAKENTKCKPEDLKVNDNKIDVSPTAIDEKPKRDKKKKSKMGESEVVVSSKNEDIGVPPEVERHKRKRKEKGEKRKEKDLELRAEYTETAAPPKKEKKGMRNDKLNGGAESNEENATITGDMEMTEPVKKEKRRKEKGVNGTSDSIEGEIEMATGVDTKRKEKRRREKDADVAKTDLDHADGDRKKRMVQVDEFENRKKKRKMEKTNIAEDS